MIINMNINKFIIWGQLFINEFIHYVVGIFGKLIENYQFDWFCLLLPLPYYSIAFQVSLLSTDCFLFLRRFMNFDKET